jgi:uncharacterized protein DUF6538
MGVMRDLNQYLKLRGQRWYYIRRVPIDYADFDNRGLISRALKTESLEVARVRRDALAEADEQFWAGVASASNGLSGKDERTAHTRTAMRAYQAARHHAIARTDKGARSQPARFIPAWAGNTMSSNESGQTYLMARPLP